MTLCYGNGLIFLRYRNENASRSARFASRSENRTSNQSGSVGGNLTTGPDWTTLSSLGGRTDSRSLDLRTSGSDLTLNSNVDNNSEFPRHERVLSVEDRTASCSAIPGLVNDADTNL